MSNLLLGMKFPVSKLVTVFIVLFSLMAFRPAINNTTFSTVDQKVQKAVNRYHGLAESPYYIIVDKSDYELKVYDEEGWYATYPIVFGSRDLGDKMKEGDKKTPNGQFKVILKKMHAKWGPELLLDYPNASNLKKFNERKQQGLLPKNARIGSGIAIHATRPGEEWTVDNFYNWTDGCVSVKYTEMKDLYSYITVGTQVTIQP